MNALFFIILTFFLIVIQSIVLPYFSWFIQMFDLLIITVLFLSFIASHHSMVLAIIGIGCIMDSISGTPFGFYLFSYLWVYIIVYIGKKMVFQRNIVFTFIISIVSVLIQHGLLLFSVFIKQGSTAVWTFDFGVMIRQVFWGIIFIPSGLWIVNVLWQNWIFIMKLMQRRFV